MGQTQVEARTCGTCGQQRMNTRDRKKHERTCANIRDYYVTVRDAGHTGWLLGPFTTHQEALDAVERGRDLANEWNAKAWFMAFGTASVPSGTRIRTVFLADGTLNPERRKS